MKITISIIRAYEAPAIKVLHATIRNAIMVISEQEEETDIEVDTELNDLGGFAGGGDPAMAD